MGSIQGEKRVRQDNTGNYYVGLYRDMYGRRVVQEDALKLGPSIHKAWAVPQTPNSVYWGVVSVKPYIAPI